MKSTSNRKTIVSEMKFKCKKRVLLLLFFFENKIHKKRCLNFKSRQIIQRKEDEDHRNCKTKTEKKGNRHNLGHKSCFFHTVKDYSTDEDSFQSTLYEKTRVRYRYEDGENK